MARKQVLVQLDDKTVKRLDRLAKRLRVSRSELLRRGAETILDSSEEAEKIRRWEEGYKRIPQTDEEWAWIEVGTEFAREHWPKW